MSGYSFPLAATTVTDDFNRANETPIGAPWTPVPGRVAAIIASNQFAAQFSPGDGFWEGEAYYAGSWTDYEVVAKAGNNIVGLSAAAISLNSRRQDGDSSSISMSLDATSVSINVRGQSTQITTSFSIGDMFGFRAWGGNVEGFYLANSSTAWQQVGYFSRIIPPPEIIDLNVFADDGNVTVSQFRIATVGQIIPPAAFIGRGAGW